MPTLERDVSVATEWWLLLADKVSSDVRGLWFGLFVCTSSGGAGEHQMCVSGTASFDTDDGGDWASDYAWEPDERYVRLPDLAAIPATDWQHALSHAVAVVTTLEPWLTSPNSLAGVAIGFDNGDAIEIWRRS